jgi:hypothetical protein
MSVARRGLKTIPELMEWIDSHATGSGVADETGVAYAIVRRAPKSTVADWTVVAAPTKDGERPRWSSARRHAIHTAQLLFDVR